MLLNDLTLFNDLGYTEITDLNSFFTVQQDVVKLYISVNNGAAVNVRETVRNLLEDEFCIRLL